MHAEIHTIKRLEECEKLLRPLKRLIAASTSDVASAETIIDPIRSASRRGLTVNIMSCLTVSDRQQESDLALSTSSYSTPPYGRSFLNRGRRTSVMKAKILTTVLLVGMGVIPASATDSLIGNTITASVTTLARVCRVRTGECKDVDTPTNIKAYFGTKGTVYVYVGEAQGLEVPVGAWTDDNQGHKVRWNVSGNNAIWEATSEQFINTITYKKIGSKCTAENDWLSHNPDVLLQARGIVVHYCRVSHGNLR